MSSGEINLKSGVTTIILKRISNLQTSLFIDCKIIAITDTLINPRIYEYLLKKILYQERIRNDREFYNIDIQTIQKIYETFNYMNSILNTHDKLNQYIQKHYPEYFNKQKCKKKKGIYIDTSHLYFI
jgi:hypothetical protein